MVELRNARIGSTMLGIEDHGIFTFYLHLDYGGGGQGFGGGCLDEPLKKNGVFVERVGTAVGMDAIMRILKVVGVDKWEDLKGKFIRCEQDMGKVYKIGHVLEDKWFDLSEHFNKWGIK